ncbi:hypothetical protein [Streptomyces sp. NPDC056975]|uniref:hypothetical protein n=1 Tax=unclassified Streptomyces TaxID=2593676 RepID=UPI00363AE3B5
MPNEILRHPRLSSDAVRLLTWQLSLPDDAKDPLSKTARQAGIGKCAFNRAKGELKREGYLHEWRQQGVRGLWSTVQLVSNVPLKPEQALALRDGAPTGGYPAAGEPTGRTVGRHPEKPVLENTPHHPEAPPEAEAEASEAPAASEAGRQLIATILDLEPRLRVPRGILPQLAALASAWLEAGHTPGGVRVHVQRSLPGPKQPIHKPGGLLRYILGDVPPAPAEEESRRPEPVQPRIARLRECEGVHTQARLFRPEGDEEFCGECLRGRVADGAARL